jgi:glycosyltransferase involved in cell wall biosynthesis
VCDDYSVKSLKKALKKALKLDMSQKQQMRKNAREMAEKSFDYRLYVERLLDFIEKIN